MNNLQHPTKNRENILAKITTESELCNDVWLDGDRGPIGADIEAAIGENSPIIDELILLIEKIAESIRYREYTIGGTTYSLVAHGHTPLFTAINPALRELAENLDLIKRPVFYGNDKRVDSRDQTAKTSVWDLGDAARYYLDMQSVRGFGDDYAVQRSDRNEGIAHALGVELVKAKWNAKPGVRAESFIRLPHHVSDSEYANNVYDVVAFDFSNNSVIATVEVELQTGDTDHVARDAAKLANAPGQSVWCVPNKACVNQLLRSLVRDGVLRPSRSDPGFPHALAVNLAVDRVRRLVEEGKYRNLGDGFPVTDVCTFNGVRKCVQADSPDVLSVQAAELRGDL